MASNEEPEHGVPDWLRWARQMQAIAQNGLTYGKDPFDRERYEALRSLSLEVLAAHAVTGAECSPPAPEALTTLFAVKQATRRPRSTCAA